MIEPNIERVVISTQDAEYKILSPTQCQPPNSSASTQRHDVTPAIESADELVSEIKDSMPSPIQVSSPNNDIMHDLNITHATDSQEKDSQG